MLRKRIATALALAMLAVGTILLMPFWVFALVFGIAAASGGYEWSGFLSTKHMGIRVAYSLGLVIAGLIIMPLQWLYLPLVQVACVVWLAAFAATLIFPKGKSLYGNPWVVGALGWVLLLAAWVSLLSIRQHELGGYWLVWMLLLTTAADAGAYLVGRRLGKRLLAPSLSPGKTWEGALGGLATALIVCVTTLLLWQSFSWQLAFLMTASLVAVAIIGDLFESLLKRSSGIKDSGDILPGHGGVLDRIDSIVAVLPVFAWMLS